MIVLHFVAVLLILTMSSFGGAQGAKILAITPLASPSHGIWNKVLLEALADRGHEVTVLIPYPGKNRTGITWVYNISKYIIIIIAILFFAFAIKFNFI